MFGFGKKKAYDVYSIDPHTHEKRVCWSGDDQAEAIRQVKALRGEKKLAYYKKA